MPTVSFFFFPPPCGSRATETILILEQPRGVAGRRVPQERSFSLLRSSHRTWFSKKSAPERKAPLGVPPSNVVVSRAISRSKRKLRNSSATICMRARVCVAHDVYHFDTRSWRDSAAIFSIYYVQHIRTRVYAATYRSLDLHASDRALVMSPDLKSRCS